MYKLPKEIPHPSLFWGGVDPISLASPVLPDIATWTTEIPGTYYVDYNHPNSVDTGSNDGIYGTPLTPRRFAPHGTLGTPLPAGTIVVMAGEGYFKASGENIFVDGTAANPVWFTGLNPDGDNFKINNKWFFHGHYLHMEHMEVTQVATPLSLNDAGETHGIEFYYKSGGYVANGKLDHVCVRHITGEGLGLYEDGSACVSARGEVFDNVNDHYIEDVVFYDIKLSKFGNNLGLGDPGGDPESYSQNDCHAVSLPSYTKRVWIIEVDGEQMGGDTMILGDNWGGGKPVNYAPEYTFCYKVTGQNNGENITDFKFTRKTIYHTCHIRPTANVGTEGGIVTHENLEDLWIMNCLFDDEYCHIYGSADTRIIGNIFRNLLVDYDSSVWGEAMLQARQNNSALKIMHNTFINNSRSMALMNDGLAHTITSNMFLDRKDDIDYDVYIESASDAAIITLSNNLFSVTADTPATDPYRIQVGTTGSGTTYTFLTHGDLGAINVAYLDNVYSDPLVNKDEQLLTYGTANAGSPTIDAGHQAEFDTLQAEFLALFATINAVTTNVDLRGDRWGYEREQGVTIDIGASEYGGVFVPVLPENPTDVFVDIVAGKLRWSLQSLNETSVEVYQDAGLVATLGIGVEEYTLGDANNSHTYEVRAVNGEGNAPSDVANGVTMSYTNLGETPTVNIVTASKSYSILREDENSAAGNATIPEPTYSTQPFSSIDGDKVMQLDAVNTGIGFPYLPVEATSSISGSVTTSGAETVDFNVAYGANDLGNVCVFAVQDSRVILDSAVMGEFLMAQINVAVDGTENYSLTSDSVLANGGFGIASIVEK